MRIIKKEIEGWKINTQDVSPSLLGDGIKISEGRKKLTARSFVVGQRF